MKQNTQRATLPQRPCACLQTICTSQHGPTGAPQPQLRRGQDRATRSACANTTSQRKPHNGTTLMALSSGPTPGPSRWARAVKRHAQPSTRNFGPPGNHAPCCLAPSLAAPCRCCCCCYLAPSLGGSSRCCCPAASLIAAGLVAAAAVAPASLLLLPLGLVVDEDDEHAGEDGKQVNLRVCGMGAGVGGGCMSKGGRRGDGGGGLPVRKLGCGTLGHVWVWVLTMAMMASRSTCEHWQSTGQQGVPTVEGARSGVGDMAAALGNGNDSGPTGMAVCDTQRS